MEDRARQVKRLVVAVGAMLIVLTGIVGAIVLEMHDRTLPGEVVAIVGGIGGAIAARLAPDAST